MVRTLEVVYDDARSIEQSLTSIALDWIDAMKERQPTAKTPHWRRAGAVLQPAPAFVDAKKLDAFVRFTQRRNVAFYSRDGDVCEIRRFTVAWIKARITEIGVCPFTLPGNIGRW